LFNLFYRYVTDNLDPFSVKTSNHFTRRFRPAPFSDAYREHITDVLERIQSLQYDCFDCGESFEDEELARDHYEYFHAIHTCRHCEKVLDNWEDFINHKQSSHGEYSIHENYIGGAWFLWEHWLCEESVKRENIISNVCYFHNYAEVKEKESSVYEEGMKKCVNIVLYVINSSSNLHRHGLFCRVRRFINFDR